MNCFKEKKENTPNKTTNTQYPIKIKVIEKERKAKKPIPVPINMSITKDSGEFKIQLLLSFILLFIDILI